MEKKIELYLEQIENDIRYYESIKTSTKEDKVRVEAYKDMLEQVKEDLFEIMGWKYEWFR